MAKPRPAFQRPSVAFESTPAPDGPREPWAVERLHLAVYGADAKPRQELALSPIRDKLLHDAADRITALEAELRALRGGRVNFLERK